MSTIADLRRDYYHITDTTRAEDFIRWNARTYRDVAGTFLVAPGPCTLGGILVIRGGSDVLVLAYNASAIVGLTNDQIIGVASAVQTTSILDGWVNCPIAAPAGLVVSINQSDAIVTILYL